MLFRFWFQDQSVLFLSLALVSGLGHISLDDPFTLQKLQWIFLHTLSAFTLGPEEGKRESFASLMS